MRKLTWFTVGFAAGCGLCVGVLWGSSLLPLLLYGLVSCLFCLVLSRRNDLFRVPAVLLLGLAAAAGWFGVYREVYLLPLNSLDGQVLPLRLTAVDQWEKTDYGWSVEAVADLEGKPYRLRAFLNEIPLAPGEVLEGDFRLRLTTPGGRKDSADYRADGLFLTASQKGDSHITSGESIWFLPARLASEAKSRIDTFFPADTAPFARALLLGDTSGLSYSQDTALKLSGIRHMVAVSGLHLSILFSIVYLFTKTNRWLLLLVSTPVLFFFGAMTGFSPSVTRACLMCFLMALSGAVNREYDSLTSLSFACLLMLLCNPFVLLSVGFQLSVASVAGILLFSGPIQVWLRERIPGAKEKSLRGRLVRWFAGTVSVTLGAQLLSVPLSAWHFGTVSLVGVLTNLLTIWVVGFLFCGIGVTACLGGVLPALCAALGWLLSWAIRYILFIARLLAGVPFGAIYTASPYVAAWLVLCYLLLTGFLLLRRMGRFFFSVGAVCLAAALAASVLLPRLDQIRLTVMDVGEGQAILLQAGSEAYLIDCGGDGPARTADQAAQTLLSQGIFRLDGVILTHHDRDHTNGLDNLLARVSAERLYLPDQQVFRDSYPEGDGCAFISRDTEIPLGSGKLVLLEPGTGNSDNENCMCVLFESEECVILITGDRSRSGERRLLSKYTLPDVDILIAGHHGSKNSTSEELLRATRPETVIISAGKNNSYGHPAPELLERLAEFNCTVYRTDQRGSVLVRR